MDPENPVDRERQSVRFETEEEFKEYLARSGACCLVKDIDDDVQPTVQVIRLAQLKNGETYRFRFPGISYFLR